MEDAIREKQNCKQCCMAIKHWVFEISTKTTRCYSFGAIFSWISSNSLTIINRFCLILRYYSLKYWLRMKLRCFCCYPRLRWDNNPTLFCLSFVLSILRLCSQNWLSFIRDQEWKRSNQLKCVLPWRKELHTKKRKRPGGRVESCWSTNVNRYHRLG